jgi:hypothetical protein
VSEAGAEESTPDSEPPEAEETETEGFAPPPAQRLDRELLDEANRYGVTYSVYSSMSPRERGAVKGRWVRGLRVEARRRNVDPDEFVILSDEVRDRVREEHPEHVPPARSPVAKRAPSLPHAPSRTTFEDIMRKHGSSAGGEDDEPLPPPARARAVADVYDEGLTSGEDDQPFSPADEVPPIEAEPKMRDRATLGEVRPVDNQDLVGWSQPKNLLDIYARYTIGDGQHFVRVERIDPKVWQQIPCSGFLGEIREPMTEPEFHAYFGGRVYALTVYGPDPKGRRDPVTGLPIIKAKTEPFRYTVPARPPNLAVLPGTVPIKQKHGDHMQSFMPGFPGFPGGQQAIPATPADAQMHRTTIDFFTSLISRGDREREELRKSLDSGGGGGASKAVLDLVSEASKSALDQANRAAESRERTLLEELRQAREDNKAAAARMEKITEQQQQGRTSPVQDAVSLMREANPGKNLEEEVQRARAAHGEEVARIRESHREAQGALKERHDDELKRVRDRLTDVEAVGRTKMDEAERRWREREKELRDQMDQQRRDEREAADRRVQETVARFDDRIKDMREQHNRELRMQSEQHTTRVDTTKSTWEFQLANSKERLEKAEHELETARAEAEQAKDPIAVITKATEQAEHLGYHKKEEKQTAGERFIGTVGMGLSKALETMDDWLPKALAARNGQAPGGPPQRALPPGPGARGPQQRAPMGGPGPGGQSRRAVAWATQASAGMPVQPPGTPYPPSSPMAPMPAQQPMAPAPVVAPSPVYPAAAPPEVYPSQAAAAPSSQGPQAESPPNGQTALSALFPPDVAAQFRQEVERAINVGLPAETFAQRFAQQFPEPSLALVSQFTTEHLMEYVKAMPNSADSPILRRDGRRWIEKVWERIKAEHQTPVQQVAQESPASA